MLGYMVLVVGPCAACLSTAMSACASLEGTGAVGQAQTARAMFGRYALALIPLGAVLLGAAWRLPHPGRPAALTLGEGVGVLCAVLVAFLGGCLVGSRVGAAACRSQKVRQAHFIVWCWQRCLASGKAGG